MLFPKKLVHFFETQCSWFWSR